MPRVRTEYDEKFCYELIEHCAQGLSPTSFAGKIRVSRATLYRWAELHLDFKEAIEIARAGRAGWYEEQGRQIMMNGGTGGQAAVFQFSLKNIMPEDYRDRVELTGGEGKPLFEDTDPKRLAATVIELLKDAAPTKTKSKPDEPEKRGFGSPEDEKS
jgi:hypothetical protein